MNGSRLFSCRYKDKLNLGRVQTPTLAMIVQRDYEVKNFIRQKYFTCDLDCGDLRACSVSFYVRMFEHNFVVNKEKIRRNTDVLQGFLTQSTAKFAEKTCEKRY